MVNTQPLISVVDDDRSVRRVLRRLPRTSGDATELFAPAQEFLSSSALSHTARLILDIQPKTLGAVPWLHLKGENPGSVPLSPNDLQAGMSQPATLFASEFGHGAALE
jgi:DNA-binding NtrC family response regulator